MSKHSADYMEGIKVFLEPSEFINSDHSDIVNRCSEVIVEQDSVQDRITKLYLHVRDNWRYNPYKLDLRKDHMMASAILERPEAYCIEKAILYAAFLRAAGVPAKVGFANVVNHIGTEKLEVILETNLLVFHGYTLVYYNDQWKIATPAFNKELCNKLGVDVLEFNGTDDSMLQQYSKEGNRYMEYVHDYGSYKDLPHGLLISELKKHYPHIHEARLSNSDDLIFKF